MKFIILISILLITGCDTFYGLRVPVSPKYEGGWACPMERLASIGLAGKVVASDQLVVTDAATSEYLFTAATNRRNTMALYALQVHAAPECELAIESFQKMNQFIKIIELHCGYTAESYQASFQCSSNKKRQGDA